MKLYRLTDANGRTRNNTQWGENITHVATGNVCKGLCSDAYIHAYENPLIAVLMNAAHANFDNPRMYECEGEIAARDGQLKCGCRTLTTIREIPLPVVTTTQKVAFALLCVLDVYSEPSFVAWANDWLTGKDRSADAAWAAARAAAWAAAWSEDAAAASWAAGAAAAAWSEEASAAEWAARAAEWAARAAAARAEAVAAAAAEKPIDFVSLAEKAMNY